MHESAYLVILRQFQVLNVIFMCDFQYLLADFLEIGVVDFMKFVMNWQYDFVLIVWLEIDNV
jgi:hypothetical protein